LLLPVTEALNVADWPALNDVVGGPTVTATGCNVTVALAEIVESATSVAVTVTVCCAATVDGA
jgi:hypothetical protein